MADPTRHRFDDSWQPTEAGSLKTHIPTGNQKSPEEPIDIGGGSVVSSPEDSTLASQPKAAQEKDAKDTAKKD